MALGALRVLRNRQYAILWFTGVISDIGTWMQTVAVAALITELTNSAAWGASTGAVTFFAGGILQPLGGVIADRHDRRRLLLLTGWAQAAIGVLLAVAYLGGQLSPAWLVIGAAVEGLLFSVQLPARSALLPDLIGREMLVDAAALGTVSWNLGRTVGPAMAGVILIAGSYSWIFVINAVTFLIAVIGFMFIRVPPLEHTDSGTVMERLLAGIKAARDEPGCSAALLTIAAMAIFIAPFIALVSAMAQIVFDGSPTDTAHFVMAQGLGSVTVALLLSTLTRRFGHNKTLRAFLLMLPLTVMVYALAPTLIIAIICLYLVGFAYFGVLIGTGTVLQLRAPARLRGRVVSLQMTLLGVLFGISGIAQGALGDVVGVRQVLFVSATLFLGGLIAVMILAPRRLRDLDGDPLPDQVQSA